MLNPLDAVDWSSLTHAYGEADDVPGLIGQLADDDWQPAADDLASLLVPGDELFPATVVALPFLVEVALDPQAGGRVGALQLLGVYGRSLMDGVGPEFLLAEAFAGLGESARAALPLAGDADPEVRAALYRAAVTWPDPVATLRGRLAAEDDSQALVALAESLGRLGALTPGDLEALLGSGQDDVVFAVAWSAVVSGRDLPGAVEHLVRLWPEQAYSEDHDPLGRLVRAAGARAVPVLGALDRVAVGELAWAWHDLALISRAAGEVAAAALVSLASRVESHDLEDYLGALIPLLPYPGAGDALARLDPGSPEDQAALAVALFAVRDPRWLAAARDATAASSPPYLSIGGNSVDFATALASFGWPEPGLADLARTAIAAWPDTVDTWTGLLTPLPPSSATVDVLLGSVGPVGVPSKQAMRLLAHAAALQPDVFDAASYAAVRDLPVPGGDAGAWLLVTQALLGAGDQGGFGRAWRMSESGPGEDELLRIWASHAPSPELDAVCLELVTRSNWGVYRSRAVQVAALEILFGRDGSAPSAELDQAWSALLGLLDVAGPALGAAVALGNRLVVARPELREAWLTCLRDLAVDGQPVAVEALQVLGDVPPEHALDLAVQAVRAAAGTRRALEVVPAAARVIRDAVAERPDLRSAVGWELEGLVGSDQRTLVPDDIAADSRLVGTLRDTLSA
ncbi:hypothetical protein [Kineosporia succinea]|uniref:HEAT repeat protein n=1 Tax=Kineosporia succinea TaxID=84632 RepID=A0ABT9P5P3_9ACTN|nr:hypothetical protein [Kineosporia succinea]MDP9827997.1 hypothetical protein [Kineosporia succinea]